MNSTEYFDLRGRVAFVTGSNTGIGKSIARILARFGAFVHVHSKDNKEECIQVVQEIKQAKGKADYCLGDLSNDSDLQRILAKVKETDILVLNASVQIRRELQSVTRENFDEQMIPNVWSSVRLVNEYYPAMRNKRWGRILFIGSVQQVKPHPQMVLYAASKAANENIAVNLAAQFAPDNITVNTIAPGVIVTGRNKEALADRAYAEKVKEKIPLGFFGEPDDCSGLAVLLCSDAGRYITGQTIYCDGGMSL